MMRHGHSSGRWSVTPERWRRDLVDLVDSLGLDVLTVTESRGRAEALDLDGWLSRTTADSGVAWRSEVWRVEYVERLPLAPDRGYFKPVGTPLVILGHRVTGERWLVGSTHMPIERVGFRDWVRGRVKYAQALRHLRRRIRELCRVYDVDAVVIGGDWNRNLLARAVRVALRLATGLKVSTPRKYRGPGTGPAGRLVIDGSLVSLNVLVKRWRVLEPIGSSDHRPFIEVLKIGRLKGEPRLTK